jgi:hypothetical protein
LVRQQLFNRELTHRYSRRLNCRLVLRGYSQLPLTVNDRQSFWGCAQ